MQDVAPRRRDPVAENNRRPLPLRFVQSASDVAQLPDAVVELALVGRSNVGKSTFLNSALGMPLAVVSRTPQTTRDALLGVVNSGDAQLAFVDTPGLHHPKNELGRRMNQEATESLRGADAALFMTDAHELESPAPPGKEPARPEFTRSYLPAHLPTRRSRSATSA